MSKEKIEKLRKRNTEINNIIDKDFKTIDELKKHRVANQSLYDEYYSNVEEIEVLEWELKTPAEKNEILRQRELSKLKREGKL